MGSLGGNVVYAGIGAHMWIDDVVMVARLGWGYPQQLLDRMAAAGLRLDGLVPSSHHAIRQWQLYDVEGGRRYVRLASAGTYADLSPRSEDLPDNLARPRACHVAPMPLDIQAELVDWARERGATVTLDPHIDSVAGHAAGWRELLPHVDAFLPSREEAQELLGGWPGAEAAARGLAELGADVMKIEPPEGSPTRRIGPYAHGKIDPDHSLTFWYYNTNKRSAQLDYRTEDGKAALLRLVAGGRRSSGASCWAISVCWRCWSAPRCRCSASAISSTAPRGRR